MRTDIKVGITHGDINGIGYEVIFKALEDNRILESLIPIIYGSSRIGAFHRKTLEASTINLNSIRSAEEATSRKVHIINCIDDNVKVDIGKSTEEGGAAALAALKLAVEDLKNGKIDVLVTAPINKKNIQSPDFHFPGHTEYLEQMLGGESLMFLVGEKIRVGVVTGHQPLNSVAESITVEQIVKKLRVLNASLKNDFTIRKPRIAVLGLNPHAGDDGLLGTEEKEIIIPAIEQAKKEGIMALGPFAADGLFGSGQAQKFDAILAMYHDQGLIPFKTLEFSNGVNYTAGLPFIRTSPDHGTAYEIAGTNMADESSFRTALFLAVDIFNNRTQNKELSANPLKSFDSIKYQDDNDRHKKIV